MSDSLSSTPTAETVAAALHVAFDDAAVDVTDDSYLHAGHAGARDGRHFSVRVVSERFNALSRLARHRLVYDALSAWMPGGIHALALTAVTPGEMHGNPRQGDPR